MGENPRSPRGLARSERVAGDNPLSDLVEGGEGSVSVFPPALLTALFTALLSFWRGNSGHLSSC